MILAILMPLLMIWEFEISIRSSAFFSTYVVSIGGEESNVEMRYEDENIWLTQKMMAVLYNVGTNTINYHLQQLSLSGSK